MFSRLFVVTIILMAGATAALVAWSTTARPESRSGAGDVERAPSDAVRAQDLPAPKGPVVLTVSGVAKGNVGRHTTKLDFKTLDSLAREEFEIYEPFIKQDVTFTGIRMSDLLAALGLSPSANSVYMHALDDYHVDVPANELKAVGVLATRRDGKRLSVSDGGPVRVVFTGSGKLAANTDMWIWSVDQMRARQ